MKVIVRKLSPEDVAQSTGLNRRKHAPESIINENGNIITKSIMEWARFFNVKAETLYSYLRDHHSFEQAYDHFHTEKNKKRKIKRDKQ